MNTSYNTSATIQKEVMDLYSNILKHGIVGAIVTASYVGKSKLKSMIYYNNLLQYSQMSSDIIDGLYFFIVTIYMTQAVKIGYSK